MKTGALFPDQVRFREIVIPACLIGASFWSNNCRVMVELPSFEMVVGSAVTLIFVAAVKLILHVPVTPWHIA